MKTVKLEIFFRENTTIVSFQTNAPDYEIADEVYRRLLDFVTSTAVQHGHRFLTDWLISRFLEEIIYNYSIN